MITVIDEDTLTMSAIFRSVPNAMREDTWQITVQCIFYSHLKLKALMPDPTQRTITSIPLWMTNERLRYVEPGAQMYEGGNVMIIFLSHVFFLISIVCHPYFHFTLHEEIDHYLLAFDPLSLSLFLPL